MRNYFSLSLLELHTLHCLDTLQAKIEPVSPSVNDKKKVSNDMKKLTLYKYRKLY